MIPISKNCRVSNQGKKLSILPQLNKEKLITLVKQLKLQKHKIIRWAESLTSRTPMLSIAPKSSRIRIGKGVAMNASTHSEKQITSMLRAWGAGEHEASDDLVRAVFKELQRQARYQLRRERVNHTLNTSALINEAYLKLVEQRSVQWKSRGQFFALAAELMRRILVDHAKTRHRKKRGGVEENLALDDVLTTVTVAAPNQNNVNVLALDEALNRLAEIDKQQVQIVELRYFSGLSVPETADVLNVSTATVKRDWAVAKAWLKHELTRGEKA